MRSKRFQKFALTFIIISTLHFISWSQYCDSVTPTFQVDLSASPYMSWTSPSIYRDGYCCGSAAPDKCLEFVITLNPQAAAIIFNIASGAVPPGALYYQIDCGPPIAVGSPICLNGSGPFHLTFCKPGNNANSFSIETIPDPIFGPDVTLGDGCSDELFVQFYDESTVTWNSISPGTSGQYNSYLNCTSGCDTVSVTASGVPPSTVSYLVCGLAQNGCVTDPVCDTINANFISPVQISLNVPDTVLCYSETSVPASVSISGGSGNYTYSWSNGNSQLSTNLPAGTSTFTVTDNSACAAQTASVTITQLPPPSVNAGGDIETCSTYIGAISLNGTSSNTSGVIWSGGSGVYSPNNTSLNVNYFPTAAEAAGGILQLTLQSNDTSGCPPVQDGTAINFNYVSTSVTLNTTSISCYGANDGTAVVQASGSQAPYTYSFDNGTYGTTTTASNLSPGIHTVSIMNNFGCDSSIQFTITEPDTLVIQVIINNDVSCYAGNDGFSTVDVNGGTTPYVINWNSAPAQMSLTASNLTAGTYTATVTDANNCLASIQTIISQPDPIQITFNEVPPSCFGYSNGAISSSITGGTGNYNYLWSTNSNATSIYSVSAGTYSLTVTDSNNCVLSASTTIDDPTQLTVSPLVDTTICNNTSYTVSIQANGGTGTYAYNWIPTASNQAVNQFMISGQTQINCTVSDNNGCQQTVNATISVIQLLSNELLATASDTLICAGDSTLLQAFYTGTDNTISLQWSQYPSCPNQYWLTPDSSGYYSVTATNSCNQSVTASVYLTIIPLPVVNLDTDMATVCPEEYFSVSNNIAYNPQWTYYWDFGDGTGMTNETGIHAYSSQGIYPVSLTITNEFGCKSNGSTFGYVTVNPAAIADFEPSSFEQTTLNPVFQFTNTSLYANQYTWHFGDGASATTLNSSHEYVDYGNFTVTLIANNQYNCPSSYQQIITIKPAFTLFIPNAFTPDGDSYNELFMAVGEGISENDFEFLIFNRWGEIIFKGDSINEGWDGTYPTNQNPVQDGVYTWMIHFRDLMDQPHQMNGHVTIIK